MRSTPPYITPDPTSAVLGPWMLDEAPLPELDDTWDPSTDLTIRRSVDIDASAIRRDSGLPGDTPLALAVTWRSMPSHLSGAALRIAPLEPGEQVIEVVLPGERIGGTLTIRTTITLAEDVRTAGPGVAHAAGSVLIEESQDVVLQGDAGRFPVTVEDFAECPWDTDASWHLTLGEELRAPFIASCWLSINSRDRELVDAITSRERSERELALIDETFHAVTMLMIEAGELAERTYRLADGEWPAETLGSVLVRYVDPARQAVREDVAGLPSLTELTQEASRRDGLARRMGLGRSFS